MPSSTISSAGDASSSSTTTPISSQSLGVLLRDDGHEVRCANDGLHALEEAAAWPPDLVLLDIYMPGPTGFVTARRLRANCPGRRMVLVMTSAGDLDEATLAGAGEAGFDLCVDKTNALTDVRAILADHFPASRDVGSATTHRRAERPMEAACAIAIGSPIVDLVRRAPPTNGHIAPTTRSPPSAGPSPRSPAGSRRSRATPAGSSATISSSRRWTRIARRWASPRR